MGDFPKDRLIVKDADILSATVDDHLVLLSSANSEYYDLDAIAADIWARLETPKTVGALRDELIAAYEGAPAQIEADLLAFLDDMRARGALRLDETP